MNGVGPTGDARGTSTESGPDQSNTAPTQAPDTTQAAADFTELRSPTPVRSLETLADAKELATDLLRYEEHVEFARSAGMLAQVTPGGTGSAVQYGSVFQNLKGVDLQGQDASGIKILHNGQVQSLGDVVLSFDIENEADRNALKTLLQGTVYDEHTRFIAAEPEGTDRNAEILARLEKVSSSYSNDGSELHNLSGILKFAKDGFVWAVPESAPTGPSVEATGQSHPRQITAPRTDEAGAAQDAGVVAEPSASTDEAEVPQVQTHDSEPDAENDPTTEESPLKRLAGLYRSSSGDGSNELSDDEQVLEQLTQEGKAAEWFRRMTARERVEALDILIAVAGEDNSPEEKSAHSKHVGVTGMTAVWLDLTDAHVDLQNRASSASRGGNESKPAENSVAARVEPMPDGSNPETNPAQEVPEASLSLEYPEVKVRLTKNQTNLILNSDRKGEELAGDISFEVEIRFPQSQTSMDPYVNFKNNYATLYGALISQFDKSIIPDLIKDKASEFSSLSKEGLDINSRNNMEGRNTFTPKNGGVNVILNRALTIETTCNRSISRGESIHGNLGVAQLFTDTTLNAIEHHLSGSSQSHQSNRTTATRNEDGMYDVELLEAPSNRGLRSRVTDLIGKIRGGGA